MGLAACLPHCRVTPSPCGARVRPAQVSFVDDVNGGEPLSDVTAGAVTAMFAVGAVVASLPPVSGALGDALGRKHAIALGAAAFTLAAALQGVASGLALIFVGRFVGGLSIGVLSTHVPVCVRLPPPPSGAAPVETDTRAAAPPRLNLRPGLYLSLLPSLFVRARDRYQGELAPPALRGTLVTLYQLAITVVARVVMLSSRAGGGFHFDIGEELLRIVLFSFVSHK